MEQNVLAALREVLAAVKKETVHAIQQNYRKKRNRGCQMFMNLSEAREGEEYIVKDIFTEDEELNAFLFSLGCYSGEPITVIAHRKGGCVVSIKDARYNIDTDFSAGYFNIKKIVISVTVFLEKVVS